jgi:hypothetical protein
MPAMWRIRHWLWQAFFPVCLLLTIGFITNATLDMAGLVGAAQLAGCGKGACRLARTSRGPMVQTVTFANPGEDEIVVDCRRESYFVGPWACTKHR